MAKPIGVSFLPTEENSPEGRGQPSSLGQALEILSLRLPKVRGARGISPQVYGQGAPPGGYNPYAEIIKAMIDSAQGGGGAPPAGPGAGGVSPLAPPRLPGGGGPPQPFGGGPLADPTFGGGPMAPMGGGGLPPLPPSPMLPPLPSLPPPPSGPPSPKIIPGRGPAILPPDLIDKLPSGSGPGGVPTFPWPQPPIDVMPPPIGLPPIGSGPIGGPTIGLPSGSGPIGAGQIGPPGASGPAGPGQIGPPGLFPPGDDSWAEPLPDPGSQLPLQPRRRGQWNEYFFS